MRSRIIIWVMFYACTLVAAGGAIWFVGDLNANKWIAPSFAPPAWLFGPVWTTLPIKAIFSPIFNILSIYVKLPF